MTMSEAGKGPSDLPAAPVPPAAPPELTIEEFKRLVLKIAVITAAVDHPNADRLLVLTLDLGDGSPRQVVAGIKGSYQAAELVGKRVVVVANLKPAALRGVQSSGMVLAASDGASITLLTPERPMPPGSPVK